MDSNTEKMSERSRKYLFGTWGPKVCLFVYDVLSRSPEKSAIKDFELKIAAHVTSLKASEKARKAAEFKLKQSDQQVRVLWS